MTSGHRGTPEIQGLAIGILVVGFILGAMNAGVGNPIIAGLFWVAATALGAIGGGLILSWLLMDVVFSRSDSEKLSGDTGVKLILFLMVLGAVVSWGWMWRSINGSLP